jgi:Amt family ammonium transporter
MGHNLNELRIAIDTLWIITMGLLVFFMNCGFAMLETGFCRVKNAVNMLSKNVVVFFVSTLSFWIIGFSFLFANSSSFISLPTSLFFAETQTAYFLQRNIDLPIEAIFFFQVVFAGTAATIVSGAVAERVKFVAFLVFTFFMTSVIYPVAAQSILGKGILYQIGVRDFAGSLMIHTVGGMAALAGVIILGPRVGKYNKDLSPNPILGHSIPMITLGGFILWLGWFGFNLGCTFGFLPKLCAHIALCTNASAITGGIGALAVSSILLRKPDLSMVINGLLGGLVASTGSCAYVSLFGAHIIGFIAGCMVVISILAMDRFFHIDDPVGAISVHGICGIWGALAVGLFSMPINNLHPRLSYPKPGLFYGGDFDQFIYQSIGIIAIALWAFVTSFLIWTALKFTIGLRVPQKEEVDGLDIGEHGMEAYPGFVSSGEGII